MDGQGLPNAPLMLTCNSSTSGNSCGTDGDQLLEGPAAYKSQWAFPGLLGVTREVGEWKDNLSAVTGQGKADLESIFAKHRLQKLEHKVQLKEIERHEARRHLEMLLQETLCVPLQQASRLQPSPPQRSLQALGQENDSQAQFATTPAEYRTEVKSDSSTQVCATYA